MGSRRTVQEQFGLYGNDKEIRLRSQAKVSGSIGAPLAQLVAVIPFLATDPTVVLKCSEEQAGVYFL